MLVRRFLILFRITNSYHSFHITNAYHSFHTLKTNTGTGKELRRTSRYGAAFTAKSKQKAKFRPLLSLSKAFSRHKQELESSSDEEDYSSDESDDAYYNPDGAEDDWDMCDPDERQRNTFVALVTRDKFERGILNYEEMCHMFKQLGKKPPPPDYKKTSLIYKDQYERGIISYEKMCEEFKNVGLEAPPFDIKKEVERSARQKYAKGIITYDECCYILKQHGVTDYPKRMEDQDGDEEEEVEDTVKDEGKVLKLEDRGDFEEGAILGGTRMGQISPSRFSRKKKKPLPEVRCVLQSISLSIL